jgi:hypothetical protein
MSDSEDDVVAVDVEVDEEDQSDGNSDDDDDEELVVVAEAVEEESEDEAGAVEVEVEEPEEDDENVALVVEDDEGDGDNDEEDEDEAEEVVEVAADVDDGEENDDVQPQVVVMEEDEGAGDTLVVEAEAVAVAVEEDDDEPPAKRSKTNTGKAKTRTPKKKAVAAKTFARKAPAAKKKRALVTKKAATGTKGKPKKGSSKAKSSSSGKNGDMHFLRIDSRRMMSANTARELLYETVQKMPFPVNTHQGDTFSVRSFGQLKVATKNNEKSSNKFSTPTSLYPVGFSCDRIEFSPSHGRFLKLRCAILDGTRVGIDGPLFRVLWGQGIDEDKDKVEYPYDPFSNSAPITGSGADGNGNDDEADDVVVAIPTSAGYQPPSSQVAPAVGMRVKTRFDKDKYYYGTISAVTEKEVESPSSKGKRQTKNNKKKIDLEIAIKYDDGSAEVSVFPDPDISLVMPGAYHANPSIFSTTPYKPNTFVNRK